MPTFRRPKDRNDWFAVILGLPMLVFPALALFHGVQSLTWPTTDGVVTYSKPKSGSRTYRVDLRYRYSYAGREYAGDDYRYDFTLYFGRVRSAEVDAIQARYPVGEPIKVAVNPASPSQSVMEPGPDLVDLLPLGFGVLLLVFGATTWRAQAAAPAIPTGTRLAPAARYRTAKWLLAIGCVVLLFGVRELYRGWSSLSWSTVQGKVLYSSARRGPSSRTSLWYEYYVGKTRYVADQYRTGGNATPFDDVAIAAARRYPVGRLVTVYYNPANPGEALLEPGVWYGNFVMPGIGLLLLGIAWVAKKYADAVLRVESARAR
jgi:hypothetical protein